MQILELHVLVVLQVQLGLQDLVVVQGHHQPLVLRRLRQRADPRFPDFWQLARDREGRLVPPFQHPFALLAFQREEVQRVLLSTRHKAFVAGHDVLDRQSVLGTEALDALASLAVQTDDLPLVGAHVQLVPHPGVACVVGRALVLLGSDLLSHRLQTVPYVVRAEGVVPCHHRHRQVSRCVYRHTIDGLILLEDLVGLNLAAIANPAPVDDVVLGRSSLHLA